MQSNNPVFRRSAEFNRGGGAQYSGYGQPQGQYGQGQYGQAQYGQTPYGGQATQDPYAQYGQPYGAGSGGGDLGYQAERRSGGSMTVDTVVQKTAMTLGVVILTAFATWVFVGDVVSDEAAAGKLYGALMIGSLGAFALSMVNSFKRVVSPALVIAFAAFEGVALGALSTFFGTYFGGNIVIQAVIGTFAAFAGTLTAYKVFNIQVGNKFRMMVMAAMFGMVGLGMMELVLSLFNADLGLFGFGGVGLIFAIVGLVLGVFMLVLDFDFVEQGVRNGLPEAESWRAAFAMTVSLVWIYTNLLRILAILQQD